MTTSQQRDPGKLALQDIEALLAAPEHQGHPLHAALAATYQQMQDGARQLDRVARISDRFQSVARSENASLVDRLDRQIRQLEKIARISDRYQAMLQQLNQRLEFESTHDALTSLANRRHASSQLEQLAGRGQSVYVGLGDIDHFKQINDRHGHHTGDQALIQVAKALVDAPRQCDFVARWGGEEFLLLWYSGGEASVVAQAEALRLRVQALQCHSDKGSVPLTISIGVVNGIGQGVDSALSRADEALYAAKIAGRNRVMLA